jgi:hypothetical protein
MTWLEPFLVGLGLLAAIFGSLLVLANLLVADKDEGHVRGRGKR